MGRSGRMTDCCMTKNITTGTPTNKRLATHDSQSGIASRAMNGPGLPTNPQLLAAPSESWVSRERVPACLSGAYGHRENYGEPLILPNIAGSTAPRGHGTKLITAPDRDREVNVFFKKLLHVGHEEKQFGVGCDPMRGAGNGDPDTASGWSVGEQDHELLTIPHGGRSLGWKGGGWPQ